MNPPIEPRDRGPEPCGHLPNPMKRGWFQDLCMRDVFATGIHRAKQKPQPEELRFPLGSGGRTRLPQGSPRNRRPPGYETSSTGASLSAPFCTLEAAY